MILKVRKYGDPILRRKADAIPAVTPEIKGLIADMIETMYDQVGIGLAAPQVGIPLRLILVDDNKGGGTRPLINPAITGRRGSVEGEEGCLSIPGIFAPARQGHARPDQAEDQKGGASGRSSSLGLRPLISSEGGFAPLPTPRGKAAPLASLGASGAASLQNKCTRDHESLVLRDARVCPSDARGGPRASPGRGGGDPARPARGPGSARHGLAGEAARRGRGASGAPARAAS